MNNTTAPTFGDETLPFEATVCELQQVARYWTQYSWHAQLFRVYHGWTSVSDSLKLVHADKRLTQIRSAIGENAFREVKDEIDAGIRQQIGEEDWAAITGSDEAAYERFARPHRRRGVPERECC